MIITQIIYLCVTRLQLSQTPLIHHIKCTQTTRPLWCGSYGVHVARTSLSFVRVRLAHSSLTQSIT